MADATTTFWFAIARFTVHNPSPSKYMSTSDATCQPTTVRIWSTSVTHSWDDVPDHLCTNRFNGNGRDSAWTAVPTIQRFYS